MGTKIAVISRYQRNKGDATQKLPQEKKRILVLTENLWGGKED